MLVAHGQTEMYQDFASWRAEFASDIVGESAALVEALRTIHHVAGTSCTMLITGETGTGKELFARAIHRASSRRGRAFIPVNCAAIPETLIESELFGHVKGAFTGANTARNGRFVSAHEGTIFLDEIGDLPLSAQGKLLRVLEERMVCPVGSDHDIPIDVRVVAATHRNLEQMVAQGTFRADLYFRLAVVPLHLPALRERIEDVDHLADLAIARFRERTGRQVEGLEPSARAALRTYHWPGNVRELGHLLERAVLLARRTVLGSADLQIPGSPVRFPRGSVTMPALPKPTADELQAAAELASDTSLDLRTALENLERKLIERALAKSNGNRTEAAALLGLNRTTLVEKLRKYGS